jgi:hypothetical protein
MRTDLRVRIAGLATGSRDLKNTRQPGLSSALLRIMQTVMRSMFGISDPQTRNASPVQACCCSGVSRYPKIAIARHHNYFVATP